MTNPAIIYSPYSGYTVPVYPVYNDQTFLVTADTSTRYSFQILNDVIINNQKVATLKNKQFNGAIEINPENIAKNYLLPTLNFSASPIADNYDSIKSIYNVLGEEYSRKVSYSSITDNNGFVQLNLSIPTVLQTGDRLYIIQDNTNVNPEYNTFAAINSISFSSITTDIPYTSSPIRESGIIYEGCQYYDYDYNGFHTLNPHKFNVGDTVYLQMDTWSTATIKLVSGNTGTISSLSVNGVNLLSTPVSYMFDIPSTINSLFFACYTAATANDLRLFVASGSNRLHIYSSRLDGDLFNGAAIDIVSSGNLFFEKSPSMYKTKGIDATGEGWNPQISGQYTIASVPSPTSFTTVEPVIEYYNTETGSERGSFYSMNNYLFTGLTTGSTYFIMNNSNFYNYSNYQTEIAKHTFLPTLIPNQPKGIFLTNKPRTSFNYYSINDIETLDLLFDVNWNGTGSFNGGSQQGFYLKTYTGTSFTQYFIDIAHFTSGFTGSNLYKRFSFGFGAYNLNNIPNQYITPTPSGTLINDSVTSYQVACDNGQIFGNYSELITFNRKCVPNYKYHQLIFLNKWGSYDYISLTTNYQKSLAIERTQFDKKRESRNGNSYGSNIGSRGKTDMYINSEMNILLYSDWLTLQESEWLSEVFESPQVFLYSPTENTTGIDFKNLYPINIVDTDVKLFNERSRMKQFEFNVVVSNRRINQMN